MKRQKCEDKCIIQKGMIVEQCDFNRLVNNSAKSVLLCFRDSIFKTNQLTAFRHKIKSKTINPPIIG